MKKLSSVLCIVMCFPVLGAEDTDYARTLKDQGYKYCASAINNAADFLTEKDAGIQSLWNQDDANNHMGLFIASKRYRDANSILVLSGQRTTLGGCDVSFTLTIGTDKSCTSVRETSFKVWKFHGEIQGLPIYNDPTTNNVQVLLQPLGSGCIINKIGILFFEKSDLKEVNK